MTISITWYAPFDAPALMEPTDEERGQWAPYYVRPLEYINIKARISEIMDALGEGGR